MPEIAAPVAGSDTTEDDLITFDGTDGDVRVAEATGDSGNQRLQFGFDIGFTGDGGEHVLEGREQANMACADLGMRFRCAGTSILRDPGSIKLTLRLRHTALFPDDFLSLDTS